MGRRNFPKQTSETKRRAMVTRIIQAGVTVANALGRSSRRTGTVKNKTGKVKVETERRTYADEKVLINVECFLKGDGNLGIRILEIPPVKNPTRKSWVISIDPTARADQEQVIDFFNMAAANRVIKHLEKLAVLDLMGQ